MFCVRLAFLCDRFPYGIHSGDMIFALLCAPFVKDRLTPPYVICVQLCVAVVFCCYDRLASGNDLVQ